MQEEVEQKTVNLVVTIGKTALREGFRQAEKHMDENKRRQRDEKGANGTNTRGRQSVKQLVGQNQGVTSIDIAELGLKDFKKYAGKYGVDYAVVKDASAMPTKYSIFFKARDADAITGLMREYTAKRLKIHTKGRPSILAKLQKFKEIIAKMPGKAREKRKEQER